MATSLYILVLVCGAALVAGITTEERSSQAQSRRIQAGPGANHFYSSMQATRRIRPSLPAPPYAVQMEPLVQYSQRDPLYHQRQDLANITSHNSIEEKVLRVDHEPEGTNLNEAYGPPSDFQNYHQHYYREPEPIIEIIIKESNETLPAPPPPPVQLVKPTKEPVHVFYVKYKKNPKGKGDDDIIYEAPIPAITPPTDEIEHDSSPQVSDTVYEAVTVAPPPSTTLRTIIHPDSEVYHGSSLKVTFGESEVKSSDTTYEETNSPEPSIALPHKEAQSRQSNAAINTHTPIKRQGTYQTIPQEVYDQNPPKTAAVSSLPTFQTPVGKFQQNTYQQQNLQHLQFQQPQSQQNKLNFPRQVPNNQQPAFRPQHTDALFSNQQQPHQQFNQRPQFQPQPSQVQQRQVPRQQNNPYSIAHSSTQNHQQQQQRPQFRVPPQQFDQRPSHYSQPLNNPQQQRQQPLPSQDQKILHQQHLAQQQQQIQQQAAQSQFRSQPIKVPNQDFNRYNLQGFPTSQPQNTPIPLPSKPIHPFYAQHYHQQINQAQQHRQNFVPSTYQPQPQQGVQQQYRFPQQAVNLPQQPSTSKPLQSFQQTTSQPQPSVVSKYPNNPIIPNLSEAQVIKAIPQSEEHQFQPQYNQPSLIQNNQQSTIDQINQLNQLRNQQGSQLNNQLLNQQQINQQIHQQQNQQIHQQQNQQIHQQQNQQIHQQQNQQIHQQQNQQIHQQQNQQQFVNDFTSQQQYIARNNQQRPVQYSHPNQLVSTTSQPVKSTTASYQTKYSQLYSHTPTTPIPTQETPTTTTEDPEKEKEKQKKFKENLAALPDEVPDDIREQLLSSGILSNADISILDYDKVGDIPIENLPPEALENFYGAGSAPVPAVVAPDNVPAASEAERVEMKVVQYDPSTKEGQNVEDSYIKEDATQVDSVILNDSKYNRYLPLKVSGSNFPLPDESVLAGRRVNSVVVLAPVDYDFVKQAEEEEQRSGRSAPVQVQGVRFIAGNILKDLIKDPTEQNYKGWLNKEKSIPTDRQSVVLLVVSGSEKPEEKEIYMYDIGSEKLSRLRGELSTAFVEVAENNAKSQELDGLADVEGAASSLQPVRVPPPRGVSKQQATVNAEDLVMAASETDENTVYQVPTISTGYSKMAVQ